MNCINAKSVFVKSNSKETAFVKMRGLPNLKDKVTLRRMAGKETCADGEALLFPFFLIKCIRFIYKKMGADKNLGRVMVLVACGDRKLTELTLHCAARDSEVNNIAVVLPAGAGRGPDWLRNTAEELLFETGASIGILEAGRTAYAAADIIVNLKRDADKYEYAFKEGAVFADLSGDEARRWDIAHRRPDVTVFDGLLLRIDGSRVTLPALELGLAVRSAAYRRLAAAGWFDPAAAGLTRDAVDKMGAKVAALYRLGRQIDFW